ncbi:MAG: sensor histidine kinase, partial [Methylophilus sp.]
GALIWLAGPDGTSTAVENVDARQNQSSPLVQATSVEWALDFNRPVGAGTNDWPTLGYCLLPFGFPQREVLVLDAAVTLPDLHFLQLLTHQIAQAYTKLSQQMALAQAELSASEANFKKTLLTALSHDMRTPLTVILGAANVLTDRKIPLTAGQSQQLLQSIQAETTYLSQATENILTLVKLDAGASSLQLDWQSPQDVIQHVVSRYQRRSPPEALQVNVSDEEVLVRMDAVLVAHALANLIDNAICWRRAESAIEVTLSINQAWLQISVLNEGPGFAEGFAISAFAPHTQRPTGTRGFGLGLSIVNTVMQLHQGKLEISSVPDQQTCVQLLFPFVRASDLIAS